MIHWQLNQKPLTNRLAGSPGNLKPVGTQSPECIIIGDSTLASPISHDDLVGTVKVPALTQSSHGRLPETGRWDP